MYIYIYIYKHIYDHGWTQIMATRLTSIILFRHGVLPLQFFFKFSNQYTSTPATGKLTWWRHQMETISALLSICAGNSPVPGEFPTQRPVTRSFDVYFDLRPNERLSKQSWGWWFETLLCPFWRHRNETDILDIIFSTQGQKSKLSTVSIQRDLIVKWFLANTEYICKASFILLILRQLYGRRCPGYT